MIDLHNHLLPGIDDGADDIAQSLAMARAAVAEGITHMVCTPHIQPGRFDNHVHTIAPALARFRAALLEAGIALQVTAAAEVHFGLEVMAGVKDRSLPYLGEWQGRKVLLLELPHGMVPHGADRLTAWLVAQGVVPMIAHPERNRGFIASPEKLKPFLDQGCLLQVTAASLAGRFGASAAELAEALLQEERVTVLATDAHNMLHRPPVLRGGLKRAGDLVGEVAARRLVEDNPWSIVSGRF